MQIVLNPDLVKNSLPLTQPAFHGEVEKLIRTLANKVHRPTNYQELRKSPTELVVLDAPEDFERPALGFVGVLAYAYSNHEKVVVAPHDIWLIIASELAKYVSANTEACRSLFTKSSEKIEILIPTADPTEIDLQRLINELKSLVPIDVDLFLPKFSTTPEYAELAFAATFCDMVQDFYSFSTFLCGIPEIKLAGTYHDWYEMLLHVVALEELFEEHHKVKRYLEKVAVIIETIAMTFTEVDVDFWKNIFRSKNVGSGGQLDINGWIIDLFIEKRDTNRLESFQNTHGVIPYANKTTNRKFKALHGVLGLCRDERDFVYAGYGRAVYEITDS